MEEKNLGYALKNVSRLFKQKVDSSEIFRRHPDINQPSYFILRYLNSHENDVVYQKDLQDLFSFKKSTITEMLTNLETCGYIIRLREDTDGRLRRVILSAKGKQINDEIHGEFLKVENNIFNLFSAEEYQKFCDDLNKIRNFLEVKND